MGIVKHSVIESYLDNNVEDPILLPIDFIDTPNCTPVFINANTTLHVLL